MNRAFLFAITLVLAVSGTARAQDGLEQIRAKLRANGLSLYKPVNSMNGPGWLYVERRDANGSLFPSTLCLNAYDGVAEPVVSKQIILPSGEKTTTRDLSFGLSLLEGLLKNWGSASINLKRSGVESTTIEWGDIQLLELREKFTEGGQPRQVSKSCAQNVASYLDASGNFTTKVYLVIRAAAVRKLEYRFARGKLAGTPAQGASATAKPADSFTAADANVAIDVKELLTLTGSVKFLEDQRQGFVVSVPPNEAPIFIGGNAIRVKSWRNLASANTQAIYIVDASDQAPASVFDLQ